MDNYKIKVNGSTEFKEVRKLLEQLGFEWVGSFPECSDWFSHLYTRGGKCSYLPIQMWNELEDSIKELTLPQLRDLVVLKRNDVKDATHIDPEDGLKYVDLSGKWHWFNDELCEDFPDFGWHESANTREHDDHALKLINSFKDQGLISGAEAMIAALDDKDVQWQWVEGSGNWRAFNDEEWTVEDLKSNRHIFRIRPSTIKVNAELPKPLRELQQNTTVYAVTYEFKSREERNAFARKLRGNNS